jgi:NAD(P)-dependent dehydrogenase (short-subunit alcohol dehydrogenase family)
MGGEAGMTVTIVTGAASGMGRSCVDVLLGTTDHLVAVDLRDPQIDGTVGVACDVSDPAAIQRLVETVRQLGPFRALAHAAGISPTMDEARRIFDINLVGTERLLQAFEELVVAGSAAVCFSSMATYQIAPYATAEMDALIDRPLADDFLDQAPSYVGGDSGFAYGLSKRGVIRACARAGSRELAGPWHHRHTHGTPGTRAATGHARHAGASTAPTLGSTSRDSGRGRLPPVGRGVLRLGHRCSGGRGQHSRHGRGRAGDCYVGARTGSAGTRSGNWTGRDAPRGGRMLSRAIPSRRASRRPASWTRRAIRARNPTARMLTVTSLDPALVSLRSAGVFCA